MTTLTTPLSCFSLTTDSHIAHLVLNKPQEMNTMHPTFWRELDAVLTHLHKDGSPRALVISSTGKHFSAGMALETFAGASPSPGRPKTDNTPSGGSAVREATSVGATFALDDQTPEGRAIWSNRHVMEAVTAMKGKRAGDFPALKPLKSFSELG
jgi:enoyl-CoA hydratase/carnithine racemase